MIARRLGLDVTTVRKYVRIAEECDRRSGIRQLPVPQAAAVVAARVESRKPARSRGPGWEQCSRNREVIGKLLEDCIRPSEIRRALEHWGVRVHGPTLYRFVLAEFGPRHMRRQEVDDEDKRMLRLLKRHEIQVLLRAGHTLEEVAKLTAASVSSIRRVRNERPVEDWNDTAEHGKHRIGRPSVVGSMRAVVENVLKEEPSIDTAQLLHRARLAGYKGGDTAFYDFVLSLRRSGNERSRRGLEGPPSGDRNTGRRAVGTRPQKSSTPPHESTGDGGAGRCDALTEMALPNASYSFHLEYIESAPPDRPPASQGPPLRDWSRDFEVSGQNTLAQLSHTILRILDWDPRHLYEFRIGERVYSPIGQGSLLAEMREAGTSCAVPVQLVGLAQGDTLTYLFDFGDRHAFRLTVLAIKSAPSDQELPALLSYRGNDLIQHARSAHKVTVQSIQGEPPSIRPRAWPGRRGTVWFVCAADRETLMQWRRSNDKKLWQKAVSILENRKSSPEDIAAKIEKSPTQVRSWIKAFNQHGLDGLVRKTRRTDKRRATLELRRRRILEILHERPRAHGINRSTWTLSSLARVHERINNESVSTSTVSRLVRDAGYVMKKARRVLSSPDPRYREKVDLLLATLRTLGPQDLFFFVDELGPLRVKRYGGRAYVPRNESRTVPQVQPDKGSLTMAGALSATTNQVTWFYGSSKDTSAMIDLIEILFNRHPNASQLYITWDAASWHSSEALVEWLDGFNAETRRTGEGPAIHLVPLPASAQFLDVLEAVFSGMKRAVIHDSDYQNPVEMKDAISLHFVERNAHFLENPRRAGKKIWELEFFADRETLRSGNYRQW